MADVLRGRTHISIVAFGDSVTQGYTKRDTLEPDTVYHARVKRELEDRHPGLEVKVVNAGVAGDTAKEALGRLERDVLRHDPDVVLVEFGLNDTIGLRGAAGGLAGVGVFRTALAEVVDRISRDTSGCVVLLTPNFMVTRDNPRIAAEEREYLPVLIGLQTGGVVAAYADAIRQVATERDVPVADVYAAWERLNAAGRDTNELLANGLNHPGAEGHAMAADLVLEALERLV